MTYQDEAIEIRRTSVGTKVLMFACAILAVLGSFWSIVWFIRSYVEAPRVGIPAALAVASRDTPPVVPQAPAAAPAPIMSADTQPANVSGASAADGSLPAKAEGMSSLADRWFPTPAAPPEEATPTQTTGSIPAPEAEANPDEVAESSVPAISGPAPLPRRKPTQTALAKRVAEPPMPRPRPDGPAPQSVWTAVPVSDDRFPTQ